MQILNDAVAKMVREKYNEPQRHYHTWNDHIVPMLRKFEQIKSTLNFPDAVYLAIVFHDCVYEVDDRYKNNELLSAGWMASVLLEHMPEYCKTAEGKRNIRYAILCIMATEKHDAYRNVDTAPKEVISDIEKFLDIDLGILATQDKDSLLWYENAIRKEFSIYDDETYRVGRNAVLHKFLQRTNIFFGENSLKYDQQGRANLAYLIQRLNT